MGKIRRQFKIASVLRWVQSRTAREEQRRWFCAGLGWGHISIPDSDSPAVHEGVAARLRLCDIASRWHAAGEPDIAANRRTATNRDSAKDRGAGVDYDIVLNNGVSRSAFDQGSLLVHSEPLGASVTA